MNGIGHLTFPSLTMVPPNKAQSYLIAARHLFSGAETLASASTQNLPACAFLTAQSLECALKSYLSYSGLSEKELMAPPIRHNLEELWLKAVNVGLHIQFVPPQWCLTLNASHDKPYYFRYPMGLNGMALPAPTSMISELKELLALIAGTVE
jgi:hypothetical protein